MISIPTDENVQAIQLVPAKVALEETTNDSVTTSASVEITLNASTKFLEINALDAGVFMKYGTSDASSSDYDEYIMANTVRHYVIAAEGLVGITAINLIADGATAKVRVIEK